MLLITRDTDYGLRALCLLAVRPEENFSAARISKELDAPYQFLRGILQKLSRAGILRAEKGRSGGFSLIKKPGNIKVTDVMNIFQGKVDLKRCSFQNNVCPNLKDCVLRVEIEEIEKYARERLSRLTVKDIARLSSEKKE